MKDQIFIVWSGSNDVAMQIKKNLETKNYKCTIGGNADNDSKFSSIGDTVIQQIKNCNQAIVIFQNREDGMVSNNLFFELGYVLAMYGQTKVHCVKRDNEQVVLPSDFDSSFVHPIVCEGSDEKFANGIIKYFFDRQKMSINVNKMLLINNRYRMHDYIQSHFSEQGSKCSDYELAQYILFYMQAGHMFGDEPKILNELKLFKANHYSFFSDELATAVNMCITFYEMVLGIQIRDDGEFFIDRGAFRVFRDKYFEFRDEIVDDDMGTFDEWAKVFISEHLTYAYSLYSANPDISEESGKKNMEKSRYWAEQSLRNLKALEETAPVKDNNDHKGIISLLYAYVYRNLFLSCKKLQDDNEIIWLEKTKRERTALKNNFEIGSIDSQLYENFAMEYYLTLIEYLSYADKLGLDEEDIEDYREEIEKFINETKRQTDRSKYVDRIDLLLQRL